MANKEPYDYLSSINPDVDETLIIRAQGSIKEIGTKNQMVHLGDDGSEKRISLDDTSKANGIANSFKWQDNVGGHTYVVRFDKDLTRERMLSLYHGYGEVNLKLLGVISD